MGLRACIGAEQVFAGALLNLAALAKRIKSLTPERLILVCAGTFETFALEDAYAAGRLCRMIESTKHTDAALAACAIADKYGEDSLAALTASRNGQTLVNAGRISDVAWCARLSVMTETPSLGSSGSLTHEA